MLGPGTDLYKVLKIWHLPPLNPNQVLSKADLSGNPYYPVV